MKTVRAFAPATVANVSCGFDIFGFALEEPGDEVIMTLTGGPGVVIKSIEGDGGRLPMESEKNTAGVAVIALLKALQRQQGVEIILKKNLPLGSGMGSSAASSVAALVAINHLLGEPFEKKDLLPFAMEAERVACGAAHADNVAPSLIGGFVLIRGYHPPDIVNIPTPDNLFCTLVHPQVELKTQDSRQVLRATIPLKDAIVQWGNIAGLVAGLMKPDFGLISRSLKDVIVEPVRSMLIPGYDKIKEAAKQNGALGSGISGSGPTIFALSTDRETAARVGNAIASE
ncbi:MAG TPA: homoserine kinase, partial [Chryseosolibacter sp.]